MPVEKITALDKKQAEAAIPLLDFIATECIELARETQSEFAWNFGVFANEISHHFKRKYELY